CAGRGWCRSNAPCRRLSPTTSGFAPLLGEQSFADRRRSTLLGVRIRRRLLASSGRRRGECRPAFAPSDAAAKAEATAMAVLARAHSRAAPRRPKARACCPGTTALALALFESPCRRASRCRYA